MEHPLATFTTGPRAKYLPDMFGWNRRQPTVAECELVGRDVFYAEGDYPRGIIPDGDYGDYVIETASVPVAQAKLAEAFEAFGMCDAAHVIPAGVYLEE